MQLVLPADWFPPNRPGAAEYLHILYNITTPLLLLKVTANRTRHADSIHIRTSSGHSRTSVLLSQMLERSPRMPPLPAVQLGIVAVVMATGFHLAADSVTRRLLLTGYQLHLSVRENPVMQNLRPASLVGPGSDKSPP